MIATKAVSKQRARFWSVDDVPLLLAQLVADAGLDQGVLDRTLVMADFSLEPCANRSNPRRLRLANPGEEWQRRIDIKLAKIAAREPEQKSRNRTLERKPLDLYDLPQLVAPENLTTVEEMLALIAVSCQLDPKWRTWQYTLPAAAVFSTPQQQQHRLLPVAQVPWNESQFRCLTQGPALEGFLRFCEEDMFPGGDDNVSTRKLCTLLPDEYFDAGEGPSLKQELNLYSKTNRTDNDNQGEGDGRVRPC